jgi:hypothetical protein
VTDEELLALPDETPIFGQKEIIENGRRVIIPVAPDIRALYVGPDDGVYTDRSGTRWFVGWLDDRRVRRLYDGWAGVAYEKLASDYSGIPYDATKKNAP